MEADSWPRDKIRRLNDKNVSLDTSTTTLSSSFSESCFDDYLARYMVAPSDFDKFFHNKSINNNAQRDDTTVGSDSDGSGGDAEFESETESTVEAKVERATCTLHEIFVEGCCALYSDLRDALNNNDPPAVISSSTYDQSLSNEPRERELADRLWMLRRQAGELAAAAPQLADTAELRLTTLERAVQQLRIHQQQQQQTAHGQRAHGDASDATAPAQRFRKWLQASECELAVLRRRVSRAAEDLPALQRLRADHQVLQLQIETEGRALLNSAYQQLHIERQTIESLGESPANSQPLLFDPAAKRLGRWHRNLEVLEHRWYTHWLANLEGLEVVGRLIDRLSELDSSCSSQSDSESDCEEPLCKRLRRSLTPKLTAERNDAGIRSHSSSRSDDEPKRLNKSERARETPTRMLKATLRSNTNTAPTQLPTREVTNAPMKSMEISEPPSIVPPTEADHHNYGQFTGLIKNDKTTGVLSDALSSTSEGGCSRASSSSSNGAPTSQDIGYSSGENNSTADAADVQRTDPQANGSSGEETTAAEVVIKSYYRTVPLDDAGATDTECGRLLAPSLLTPTDSANHLTDSLIVQVDNNYHNTVSNVNDTSRPLDDFEEVMEMMDEQFQTQLELLRRGTQWRELRATAATCRRASGETRSPKHRQLAIVSPRLSVTLPHRISSTGSCDASSEESDNNRHGFTVFRNAHSLTASLCGPVDSSTTTKTAATTTTMTVEPTITVLPNSDDEAPTMTDGLTPRRKRYHRRSIRNPENKVNGSINGCGSTTTVVMPVPVPIDRRHQKISAKLKGVLMNESVYVTGHSDSEKSQNDDEPEPLLGNVGVSSRSSPAVRRFAATRRSMHRSASDNAALCDGTVATTVENMSVSTYESRPKHNHHHYHHYHHFCGDRQPGDCCCKCPSLRPENSHRGELLRTCSVDSCHSSSSSVTVHESGDAHFEWDEYKDLCDLMPPSCAEFADGLHVGSQKHSTPRKSPSYLRQNGSNNNGTADYTILDPEAVAQIAANGNDAFFAGGAAADAQRLARSDAESDVDEGGMRATLDASRVQLRAIEKLVRGVGANLAARKRAARRNNSHNTRLYVDKLTSARATAAEHLQRLSEHVGYGQPLDMDEISELEKLRESWTQILAKIVKMTRSYSASEPSSGEDTTQPLTTASRLSENEGEIVSLHTVLEEMKAQLGRLMKCDNGAVSAPLSFADIEAVVATRKEILRSLLHYRDDLRDLTDEAKRRAPFEAPATFQRSSDVLELMTLMEMVERSLNTIQSSTVSLERLREDFSGLCALFLSLETKIDRLNRAVSPADENDGALSTKVIEFELDLCQERMNALETICNTLSTHLSMTAPFCHTAVDSGVRADASDDEIPTEPHPPANERRDVGHGVSPIPITTTNCPGLREISELRHELERLKDRFQKVVAHQESGRLSRSPSVPTTPSRKRRFSEEQAAIAKPSVVEESQSTSPLPVVTLASVATQSDISAETVRNYEERLIAARVSRHATRASKAQTADFQRSDASESDGGLPTGGGLKRRRAVCKTSPVDATPPRFSQTLQAAVRDSHLAQLCLGCALALALGLLLLQLFGESDEARNPMLANNYRWTFGPQLDYVAGPPPR